MKILIFNWNLLALVIQVSHGIKIIFENRLMLMIATGGPLMSRNLEDPLGYWYITGITSYGTIHCGTGGIPGIYTKVSSYLEWIVENIREWECQNPQLLLCGINWLNKVRSLVMSAASDSLRVSSSKTSVTLAFFDNRDVLKTLSLVSGPSGSTALR